jgi:hypothetical protein
MAEIALILGSLGAAYIASNRNSNGGGGCGTREGFGGSRRLPNTNIPTTNYPIIRPDTGSNVNEYNNPNTATDRYYARDVDFDKMSAGVAGAVGGVGILRGIAERGRDNTNDKNDFITPSASIAGGGGPINVPSTPYGDTEGLDTQFGDNYSKDGFTSLMGTKIDPKSFTHNNMAPYYGAKVRGITAGANMHENVLDNKVGGGSQFFSKTEQAPLFRPQDNMHHPSGMPNQNDFYQSRVLPSMKISNVKPWEEVRVGPGLDQGYGAQGSLGYNSGMEAREKWIDRGVDELRVKTNPKLTYSLDGHQGPAAHYVQNAPTTATLGRMEKHLPDTFFVNTPDRWFTTTGAEKGETQRAIEMDRESNRQTTTTEYFGATAPADGGAAMYAPKNFEDTRRQTYDGKPIINPYAAEKNVATEADFGRMSYKLTHNNRTTVRPNEMGGIHGALKAVIAPLLDVLKPSRKENVVGNARLYENARMPVPAAVTATFNPADRAPTTIKETTVGLVGFDHLNVERQAAAGYLISQNTPVDTERATTSTDYLGAAGGGATRMGNGLYNAAYNQRNNVNKTYKNITNHGSMSLFNSNTNVQIDRLDADRANNRTMVMTNAPSSIPSIDIYGKMTMPQSYDEGKLNERIQPDILNAFRQNPYTHSLQTY